MSLSRLILRSLRFYWPTGVVVALGVALATAVLTGSLLVGDSVKGSIRDTALRRLGGVEHTLVSAGFFRADLAGDIAAAPNSGAQRIAAVMMVRASVSHTPAAQNDAQPADIVIPNVNIFGVDGEFWEVHSPNTTSPVLDNGEVALSAPLAADLGVKAGDDIIITLERKGTIAADTLFFHRKRSEVLKQAPVTVKVVLPESGVGEFALTAQTSVPRNLYCPREWLSGRINRAGKANMLLADTVDAGPAGAETLQTAIGAVAQLGDYGLKLVPNAPKNYVGVENAGMVLNPAQVKAAQDAAKTQGATSALTSIYLATTIRNMSVEYFDSVSSGRTEIAYAMVAGAEPLAPFTSAPGLGAMPEKGTIWLNDWAARDLGSLVRQKVELEYLIPAWDGVYTTGKATFKVSGIVGIVGPTDDRHLVPDIEGVTDKKRIDNWETPFPLEEKTTKRDNQYWEQYNATPKAFINMEDAHDLWLKGPQGAQADWITGVRIQPAAGQTVDTLATALTPAIVKALPPDAAGLKFMPARAAALKASAGSTDFGELFISMGFFLVAAAAGLAAMMMRLMADRRAAQAGIMLAAGFTAKTVARAVFLEGLLLAVVGAALGVPLGVLYGAGIIWALTNWWMGAVGTAGLWLHIDPMSLIYGGVSGLVVGALSVAWGARELGRGQVLSLLAGWQARGMAIAPRARLVAGALAVVSLVGMVALIVLAMAGKVAAPAAFFGSGSAFLIASLCACYVALAAPLGQGRQAPTLARLALRSAAANRGRSMLTIGMLAAAAFIIVTVAAMTKDYSHLDFTRKDSGTGGFALQAVSSLPVHYAFGTLDGREKLAFRTEDEPTFEGVEVMPFLLSPGEDISCLNLAKATHPRVIGVRPAMIARGGFTISTARGANDPKAWELLTAPQPDGAIPVFGDADSVMWQLHSGLGKTYQRPGGDGRAQTLRFVGLVHGSVFAGELLMAEEHFRAMFPGVSAPRYFLVGATPGQETAVAEALRRNLGDMGMEVRGTRELLNSYITVQNTYLMTFLALGGLGVLLGTLGLMIVILRNALERRREFALMLAVGFSRGNLARLLVSENAGLLLVGLACGTIAALVAVAPQIISGETRIDVAGLSVLLMGIAGLGLISSLIAAALAVRGARIQALREE